ncbi:hypothetical protein ASH00_04650 [Arthrobacter sp. Soil782]|uniref:potassium channel family protein n=1 Tax=Arthrobacter sp. Soil782 TaxID=1736410 RepID=UPI000712CC1F|nr:potassium channel family protein [Arthrobacter sp. Soil782]KRF08968.1 hypothetical protein ASH00_04650 [Arthrobacter sp. Soil782]
MEVVLVILGAVLIFVGLGDMFHTLLHPAGRGSVTRKVFWLSWRASQHTGNRIGPLNGPGAMAVVALLWVLLQAVGWALIYLPQIPGGFSYSFEEAGQRAGFVDAFYVSMVTLTTLGFGDVVPTVPWLRLVTPLEALAGFALLTAAVSWFGQVYPALARRRTLALQLSWLADTGYADRLQQFGSDAVVHTVHSLAAAVARLCADLVENTETYFFRDPAPSTSLARQLPYAMRISRRASRSPVAEVQAAGLHLEAALTAFSMTLKEEFQAGGDSPVDILAIYADEHGTYTDD